MTQGLLADKVRTVSGDSASTLWIGTGKGIQTLDGRTYSKDHGLTSDLVMSTLNGPVAAQTVVFGSTLWLIVTGPQSDDAVM